MIKDFSITSLSVNQFSIDSMVFKQQTSSRSSKSKFVLFKAPRTSSATSAKQHIETKPLKKNTQPISALSRNRSFKLLPFSQQFTSVLISNKEKLNAFTNLIDDIYQNNAIDIKPKSSNGSKSVSHRPFSSSSAMSSTSSMKLDSNQRSIKKAFTSKAKGPASISKLLAANLNSSQLKHIEEFQSTQRTVFRKKTAMNRFILKVLDPEANFDDYTSGKGKQKERFIVFKRQLNNEKLRLTNLLNNAKKAAVMNEAWLKLYTLRLKSGKCKYLKMPLQCEEHLQ